VESDVEFIGENDESYKSGECGSKSPSLGKLGKEERGLRNGRMAAERENREIARREVRKIRGRPLIFVFWGKGWTTTGGANTFRGGREKGKDWGGVGCGDFRRGSWGGGGGGAGV